MLILDITRPLGPQTPVYPGDVPFSRVEAYSFERGDRYSVSVLLGSAHAGTHVDMPRHFFADASEPALDRFIGRAEVIHVSDWSVLSERDWLPSVRPLFRCEGVGPPPAELVVRLAAASIPLVGLDIMSVDTPDDDTYPNHRTLLGAGIPILESLDLSAAPEGDYEMIALPLPIPDPDATWVRAVLLPVR
jgi:arylformamidase